MFTNTKLVHVILLCILLKSLICQAVSVVPETVNNVNVHDMITTVSYKLEVYTKTLSELASTVKSLEEKAHNWAIFRHHIDVWNMQMHTMEQKLNALQRGQDNKHGLGAKLTNVQTTLNHMLNQMELTLDNCQTPKQHLMLENVMQERALLNQDYAKTTHSLKKLQNEALARLNNILRYLQKEDNTQHACETMDNTEEDNKLISGNISQKDLRSFKEQTRKNTKSLEMVVKNLGNVQKKLANWHNNAENNVNYMTKQCQSATKELSTFSESSDLLLKRIEALVHDFDGKLNNVNWHFSPAFVRNETEVIAENTSIHVDVENSEHSIHSSTTDPMSYEEDDVDPELRIYDYTQSDKDGCHQLSDRIDGIYLFRSPNINEANRDFNERLCIFTQEGPAWTVIQNRAPYAEQEDFNRGWQDYRSGFGELHKDFWFGNEFIHKLTHEHDYELRIELEDCDGNAAWAEYKTFQLEDENANYVLIIDDFSGNATNAMSFYNEMDFSTFDHAATQSLQDCWSPSMYGGGWWFTSCAEANLNGIYMQSPVEFNYIGIIGKPWQQDYSLKRTRMMIRPINLKVDFSSKDP